MPPAARGVAPKTQRGRFAPRPPDRQRAGAGAGCFSALPKNTLLDFGVKDLNGSRANTARRPGTRRTASAFRLTPLFGGVRPAPSPSQGRGLLAPALTTPRQGGNPAPSLLTSLDNAKRRQGPLPGAAARSATGCGGKVRYRVRRQGAAAGCARQCPSGGRAGNQYRQSIGRSV